MPISPDAAVRGRRPPLLTLAALLVVVFGLAIYANVSFLVTDGDSYKYFPPFKPFANANSNQALGAEYFNIASALAAGNGFADPFPVRTGPTAWMPPAYPVLLAVLLWASGGDRDVVTAIVVFMQVVALAATGLLVLALAQETCRHRSSVITSGIVFVGCTLFYFHHCYQTTHDPWLVLLAIDLLIAGLCWTRPLTGNIAAAGWGLFGGLCAMVNPIVAMVWGVLTLLRACQDRAWCRFALAVLFFLLALAPWTIRNYLVFGRLIPVKSNLAYELYQSQCLTRDGVLQHGIFESHPYVARSRERAEYATLGEAAFLNRKSDHFWQAFRADPMGFLDRTITRCLASTLWYVPFDRSGEAQRPVMLWLCRVVHPLPFLALLFLVGSTAWEPLHRAQWLVMGIYLLYLLPYAVVSYYERYAVPLVGVKTLLVTCGADRMLTFWPTLGPDSKHRLQYPVETRRRAEIEPYRILCPRPGTPNSYRME